MSEPSSKTESISRVPTLHTPSLDEPRFSEALVIVSDECSDSTKIIIAWLLFHGSDQVVGEEKNSPAELWAVQALSRDSCSPKVQPGARRQRSPNQDPAHFERTLTK